MREQCPAELESNLSMIRMIDTPCALIISDGLAEATSLVISLPYAL